MPIIHVNAWEGLGPEKAKTIIQNITKVFMDMEVPPQAIRVIIHEVQKTHWGIGGEPASEKTAIMREKISLARFTFIPARKAKFSSKLPIIGLSLAFLLLLNISSRATGGLRVGIVHSLTSGELSLYLRVAISSLEVTMSGMIMSLMPTLILV
ncbi:MAG: tautomerase family protein [Candidatus Aminicenantes bacterium]|nr:tautomerase family protein [Candidatus Aminicenantes bacterium]